MLAWLAEILEPGPRKLRLYYWLWAITAMLGFALILALSVAVARRHARRTTAARARRKRGRPIPDAWAEAGRRVEPIRMDEPPPEVLPDPEDKA
jgi:hypothetical protein